MPHALASAQGLDWETEINSFWSWLDDATAAVRNGPEPGSLVQELVASQRERIEKAAAKQYDSFAARNTLTIAVALVGFHYASNQKLLAWLREYGVCERPATKAESRPDGRLAGLGLGLQ